MDQKTCKYQNRRRKPKLLEKSKSTTIGHEILDETVSTRSTLNIKKNMNQQKIAENEDIAKLVTVIVFDIETTGFSRQNERIIEIALQDLQGGENSTFPNTSSLSFLISHRTCMILCFTFHADVGNCMDGRVDTYITAVCEEPSETWGLCTVCCSQMLVLLMSHFWSMNFGRHHFEIPQNWLFVDTRPLAREVLKMEGLKVTSGTSLEALCKKYNIQFVGKAHRAMADVTALSLVLQRLTFDLKLPLSGLIAKHFTPSELTSAKKKKIELVWSRIMPLY
ncbi:hypothetical protein NC652_012510 [Populus alba x Populus x berolinensis]|nr:hypothetical protein NC652_012510 [Populus alba x Populus x berolinensis]